MPEGYAQRLPTPNRTVALRSPTRKVSGTQADRAFRRNPPEYGFQGPSELDGGHESKRSAAAGPPSPHVMATRSHHAGGTRTTTGGLSARTTSPTLLQ
jgi:hypothetical protein